MRHMRQRIQVDSMNTKAERSLKPKALSVHTGVLSSLFLTQREVLNSDFQLSEETAGMNYQYNHCYIITAVNALNTALQKSMVSL